MRAMPTGQNGQEKSSSRKNGDHAVKVNFLTRTRRLCNFFTENTVNLEQSSPAKRTFTLEQERAVMLARGKAHAGNNRIWMNCHPDETEQILLSLPEPTVNPQPDPTPNSQLSGGCLGPGLQSVKRSPSGNLVYDQNKIKEIVEKKRRDCQNS